MMEINRTEFSPKTRSKDNKEEIYDPFRKKWIQLTPEEWVRQYLLSFLVRKGYPASMIGVEKMVRFGERKRRYDAVVFDRKGIPWMLIECKAESEKLDEKAVSQLLAYQSQLQAVYLLLTNGPIIRVWAVHALQVSEMETIPVYPE